MKFPLFFFFLLTIATAFASDLDFTLVNQTARSFEGIYITDSGNKDWDSNLLRDGKVLAAGGKVRVRFKSEGKSETWDFNLVDDEGLSVTFNHVKLAGVDTVTLKDVNGKITAEIEWVANLFLVPYPPQFLYSRPFFTADTLERKECSPFPCSYECLL